MKFRFISFGLLPLLLTGCSAMTQPTTVNNLQIKVAHLERRLSAQENNIEQLKSEVELLSQDDQQTLTAYDDSVSLDADDAETDYVSKIKEEEVARIIRVPVSVSNLQRALTNSGFYSDAIDGKLGQNTKNGIKKFQEEHDLEADGVVGKQTWNELKNYLD